MVKTPDFNLHLGGEIPPCFARRQAIVESKLCTAMGKAFNARCPAPGIHQEAVLQMGDHGDVIK